MDSEIVLPSKMYSKVLEKDSDGDYVVDSEDAYSNCSQWADTDNDGYGIIQMEPIPMPILRPRTLGPIDAALGSEAESRLSNQTIYIGVGLMLVLTFSYSDLVQSLVKEYRPLWMYSEWMESHRVQT